MIRAVPKLSRKNSPKTNGVDMRPIPAWRIPYYEAHYSESFSFAQYALFYYFMPGYFVANRPFTRQLGAQKNCNECANTAISLQFFYYDS